MRNKLTMAMLSVVAVLQAAWVTWTLIPLLPVIVVFVAVVLLVRWSAVRSTRNDPRTIACSPLTLCTAPLRQASFVLPFAPIHATELALAPLVKWWEVRKGGSSTGGTVVDIHVWSAGSVRRPTNERSFAHGSYFAHPPSRSSSRPARWSS